MAAPAAASWHHKARSGRKNHPGDSSDPIATRDADVKTAGSCLLLVVAGLTTRGLQRMLRADPGFVFDNVAVLEPNLANYGIAAAEARAARSRTACCSSGVRASVRRIRGDGTESIGPRILVHLPQTAGCG